MTVGRRLPRATGEAIRLRGLGVSLSCEGMLPQVFLDWNLSWPLTGLNISPPACCGDHRHHDARAARCTPKPPLSGTSAEDVFGDRVAPCEYAAECVRPRAPAMGYPPAESRTPRDIARPLSSCRIPRRWDTRGRTSKWRGIVCGDGRVPTARGMRLRADGRPV